MCRVFMFLAASEDYARSNSYLDFFQQLLCSISFKQIQIFIQNTVFFVEWHVYKHSSDMWKQVDFCYPEELQNKQACAADRRTLCGPEM